MRTRRPSGQLIHCSCERDKSEYDLCVQIDDLFDHDGYLADLASDVDSPRSAHMPSDAMSDDDSLTGPRSSDGMVRQTTRVFPGIFDLLQQLESSHDDECQ